MPYRSLEQRYAWSRVQGRNTSGTVPELVPEISLRFVTPKIAEV
jgi:hypothetical protein